MSTDDEQPAEPSAEGHGEAAGVPRLDARGLRCPMPLVKTKLRVEEMADGDALVVMATDPEAAIDLSAWASDAGHALRERQGEAWTEFFLRKGGRASEEA